MKQVTSIYLLLLFVLIYITGCCLFQQTNNGEDSTTEEPTEPTEPTTLPTPTLSVNQKSIVADGEILLSIDDNSIYTFFQTESQLCNESNINSSPERQLFCEDKATFKDLTQFKAIVVSADNTIIGFTVESDILTPDSAVGILYPYEDNDKIHFLTSYAIGNNFLSFAPDDAHFIYEAGCFEGQCSLFINESTTRINKLTINEFTDETTADANFIKWISNNEVEYQLQTAFSETIEQAAF